MSVTIENGVRVITADAITCEVDGKYEAFGEIIGKENGKPVTLSADELAQAVQRLGDTLPFKPTKWGFDNSHNWGPGDYCVHLH